MPVGWRATDAVWSEDRHNVAVLTKSIVNPNSAQHQLSIYSVNDGELRELWREVNQFIDIDRDFAFHDVNGDGSPEIVYARRVVEWMDRGAEFWRRR